MDFVVGTLHYVTDLVSAADFFCRVLGFQEKMAAPNVVIVENGALSIRLINTFDNQLANNTLTVELHSQTLGATLQQLLSIPDIYLLASSQTTPAQERLETLLQAPFGIKILLVQEFDEDQLNITPELPSTLIWDTTAETCIKKMLKLVPLSFRHSARMRVTEKAEMLAGAEGLITVNLDHALQALAQTTPLFQHAFLIEALKQDGIATEPYFTAVHLC